MKSRRHAGQDLRHGNKIVLLDRERKKTNEIPEKHKKDMLIGGLLLIAFLYWRK
tara:strand:- start:516 stop:677 length:162 start_codon:yes stop_codon:yes gene_type:complete